MIFMKSPEPNHKGVFEIHRFPDRLKEGLLAHGWTEVEPQKKKKKEGQTARVFDLSSGTWFKVRKEVQALLNLKKPPKSKAEAKDLLEEAGYTFKG